MDPGIIGKVAIVTGVASSIGAATVRLLREEGAMVEVWDLNPQSGIPGFLHQKVDVKNLDTVAAAWHKVEETLEPVGILVHAAAIGSGHFGFPYTHVPVSAWQKEFPLSRWHKSEDIASMIVFLSSVRASEVARQTISIDGGCVKPWQAARTSRRSQTAA